MKNKHNIDSAHTKHTPLKRVYLGRLEKPQRLLTRQLEALGGHAGVQALGNIALSLVHQLADEQHGARCAVACDVILGGGSAGNDGGGGVLNGLSAAREGRSEEDIAGIKRNYSTLVTKRLTSPPTPPPDKNHHKEIIKLIFTPPPPPSGTHAAFLSFAPLAISQII